MTYEIGVVLDRDIKREIVLESLEALSQIEKKYDCRFSFYETGTESKSKISDRKMIGRCTDKLSTSKGKMLVSFGGEMEV